jgi:sulfide:quinone oxidoreductase
MDVRKLTSSLSVAPQIRPDDMATLAAKGFRTVISNRPDGEEAGQPTAAEMKAAAHAAGLGFHHVPVISNAITDQDVATFKREMEKDSAPVLAFCRTGTRSATLWALSQAGNMPTDDIIKTAEAAGYDLAALRSRLDAPARPAGGQPLSSVRSHDVVIIGGGAGGISVAASILQRKPDLDVAIVEPKAEHYYQPGWTLVGCGTFKPEQTRRNMKDLIPPSARWVHGAAASFHPEKNQVKLEDGSVLTYRVLVVAPGIVLNWAGVDGLEETLGRNGVTSNYRYDLAPYTWELVQNLKGGTALFTQPPMPIKCAGAPQKAMYLSCDRWRDAGVLGNIKVEFHTAGAGLFGVADYVPALMEYVEKYGIDLNLESKLVAVDGAARRATFAEKNGEVTRDFDMMHVCPPQVAPQFVAESPLADQAGYVSVDQETMRHTTYGNVFGLGDGCNSPNAKTAAAVRKQAPVVADNVVATLDGKDLTSLYDGYGSCPLTVERGKIVLAEFGYGGKLLPTFPKWFVEGTRPTKVAWILKKDVLPWVYWNGMLRGHEWLAHPIKGVPASASAPGDEDICEPKPISKK